MFVDTNGSGHHHIRHPVTVNPNLAGIQNATKDFYVYGRSTQVFYGGYRISSTGDILQEGNLVYQVNGVLLRTPVVYQPLCQNVTKGYLNGHWCAGFSKLSCT